MSVMAPVFDGSPVRIVDQNGEPWFVAVDVCRVLDLTNPTVALKALDEDERAKFNLGRPGPGSIVSESGLYTLILRCRGATTPGTTAHRFRRWVTREVLPQIRKAGRYEPPQPADDPAFEIRSTDKRWFQERFDRVAGSQRKLAKMVGMDPAAISLTLSDKRHMKVSEAVMLAQILGESIEDVVARVGNAVPSIVHARNGDTLLVTTRVRVISPRRRNLNGR